MSAYKASQSDGWKKIVSSGSVSVHLNTTNKVAFPTTMVRCEFKCPMSAPEAFSHLADVSLRNERDYFYKSGQLESEAPNKKTYRSTMKIVNKSEVQLKVTQISREQDKGIWILVEFPEDSETAPVMLYPSFYIEALTGGSSSVVALYRFDLKKVWPEMSKALEKDVNSKILDLFANEVTEPLGLSLIGLGSQREAPASPVPKIHAPPPQPSPPPAPAQASQITVPKKAGGESGEKDLIIGSKYKWKKGELIGHGAIGKVYMGLNFETGEMMAVKQVDLGQQLGPQAAEELKAMDQEIHIFSMISHPNLVRYYGMEKTPNQVLIFLEYVSGGSIASMLRKFGAFSEHMISNFTAQIVDGLAYLHSQAICHRDIKAANILYSNEGVVKLADFGTAKKIADVMNNSTGLKSLVGTPYMMAPEVIRQTGHGMPADIWSLACVLWEMATTKPPFTQFTDRIVAMYNIAHAKAPPDPPDALSEDAKSFVRACMTIQANERATTTQLLEHPFIKTVPRKTPEGFSPAALPKLASAELPAEDRNADKDMPAIGEEGEEEWGAQVDSGARDGNFGRRGSKEKDKGRTPSPSVRPQPSPKAAYSPAHAKLESGGAHRRSSKGEDEQPRSGAGGKERRWEEEEEEERKRGTRSRSRSRSESPASVDTKKGGKGKHKERVRASRPRPGEEVELSDSTDEDEDGGRVQAALSVQRGGGGGKKKGKGKLEEEIGEDGLTREQCREIGKPFRPAQPLFGYRLGSRDERSDSEESEAEESEDEEAQGNRLSASSTVHHPHHQRHHHHHKRAGGGGGGGRSAPKTKSATYDEDSNSSQSD